MPKASAEADKLWPYLIKKVERVARTAGSGGAAGVGGAPSPHALSSSHHTGTLADHQGPQFLLADGSRALAGHLTVDPGVTIDGVDLGAFKALYDAHVANPDAHHNRATAGDGLSISVQQLSVNQAFGFVWTAEHRFDADIQLDANLDFIGGDRVITASSDLTFTPVDDLILTATKTWRSSDYADGIPITGFSSHINAGGNRQLTINSIKADELHVRLFVADTVRVDVGEEYWGKSMGIVHDDFTTPGSIGGTVTVKFEDSPAFSGALFSNNDWLLIRIIDDSAGLVVASIWGQVSSYADLGDDADGRGHQSWTFTLRQGPTSQEVKAGNVAVDFGASGQGYIHLSTLDSADGPWFRIGEWSGANPYTPGNNTIGTQIGLLDGISDADLNPSGYGLYSDNAYLSGIVRTVETIMDDNGLSLLLPDVTSGYYPSTHAYVGWFTDLDDLSGFANAHVAAWRDTTTPSSEYNYLSLGARDDGSEFAIISLVATGDSSTQVLLDSRGVVVLDADTVRVDSADILPNVTNAQDIGSATKKWKTLYATTLEVDSIDAGTVSGASLGGQIWTYAGSMIIDADLGTDTTVAIDNSGAGRADLDVDRNITLGGTVDGVDIATFSSTFTAHAADAAAHHALASAGNTAIGVTGQAISLALATNSGLQISSGLLINPAFGGDGLTITAGVMGVDATVARTTIDMIAGAGLTGGGTLAANRTFNVGAGDGISVGADAVAVDGTVVRTTRDLIAGAGLTGGGTLAANRTFNVGAGDGISVADDAVAVDGTVVRTSRTITAGAGLTGGGDLSTNRTLDVGAGFGISVAADSIAVNQAMVPTWTGMHQFNADIQLNADLDFLGARTVTTDSSNNLTFAPGGDLVLNPGGADVLPGGSSAIDLGDYNRKWRTLYVGELYTENLVAQDVMATIGGRVLITPTTSLIADAASGASTIDVKHNNLANGMFVRLENAPAGVPQLEVMKVTSSATVITGGYRYSVSRNQDGTGANDWLAGDGVASLRTSAGEGWIDLSSSETVLGDIGPTIAIYARTAATNWDDVAPVAAMGNLESFVDYSADEFGFAAGNDLTLTPATNYSGFTIDRTAGLRLFNTDLSLYSGSEPRVLIDRSDGITIKRGATSAVESSKLTWMDDLSSGQMVTELASYVVSSDQWAILQNQAPSGDAYLFLTNYAASGGQQQIKFSSAAGVSTIELNDADEVIVENTLKVDEIDAASSSVIAFGTGISIPSDYDQTWGVGNRRIGYDLGGLVSGADTTYTVTLTYAVARVQYTTDIRMTIGAGASVNRWGTLAGPVLWRTGNSVGDNGVVMDSSGLSAPSGSNVNFSAITPIANGIQFTASITTGGTDSARDYLLLDITGNPGLNVSVTVT